MALATERKIAGVLMIIGQFVIFPLLVAVLIRDGITLVRKVRAVISEGSMVQEGSE